jgi:hypothetical protein
MKEATAEKIPLLWWGLHPFWVTDAVYSGMDTRGWVLKAIETLRFASEKDIMRWLDEEGEALSKDELRRTLELLLQEDQLELKNDLFRLKRKSGSQSAFDSLFKD